MTDATPSIHVSADAHALIAEALARGGNARYVRVRVGRGWSGFSYRLALDESAGAHDVVIDAGGIQFVAEKAQASLVSGLRLEVEESYGRKVLVATNETWSGPGGC